MAAGLILEFEGVTAKEYEAVNRELGIDVATGKGNWPAGLISHSGGLTDDGRLIVTEVWDSAKHQSKFMDERLGEALQKGGVTAPPSRMTWIELIAHHHPGG